VKLTLRRTCATIALTAIAVVLSAVSLAACGSLDPQAPTGSSGSATGSAGSSTHSSGSPAGSSAHVGSAGSHTGSANHTATVATAVRGCLRTDLVAWLAVPRTGFSNASNFYDLEISNVSAHDCSLYGYPGVSALRTTGSQLGSAAGRAGGTKALITLAPGGTAHSTLYISDSGDYPASACHPATAGLLRVYAPGDYASMEFAFSFPACARRGPVYLNVSTVTAGTGVPGGNG
jgi:predicted small lipoprotein YifL